MRTGLHLAAASLALYVVALVYAVARSAYLAALSPWVVTSLVQRSALLFGVPLLLGLATALLYLHRTRVGADHARRMAGSVVLLAASAVAMVTSLFVSPLVPPLIPQGTPDETLALQTFLGHVGSALRLVGELLIGLALYLMVVALVPAPGRRRLQAALVLTVLGVAAAFGVGLPLPGLGAQVVALPEAETALKAPTLRFSWIWVGQQAALASLRAAGALLFLAGYRAVARALP